MSDAINAFVQLGAARDGLDPYLECARRRGMPAVLVDTPAFLKWRQHLGLKPFDIEIPVAAPEAADQVSLALRAARVTPAFTLAGFERYAQSAFLLAGQERIAPWPHCGMSFTPPDKASQREALALRAPEVLQPAYVHLGLDAPAQSLDHLAFPQVVKPVDGAGGLGVYLVRDESERDRALREAAATRNYGGAAFTGLLVEECVQGTEHSLQCLALEGKARILSVCEKVVLPEQEGVLPGFREAGHMAAPGDRAPCEVKALAQSCLDATGYEEGPFHVDLIRDGRGPYFLEMGFRLSGFGLVSLVERATGVSWAEATFTAHLDRQEPLWLDSGGTRQAVGQLVATDPRQLACAHELAASHPGVHVHASPALPDEGQFSAHELETLASDRRRHAAILGRVTLRADSEDEVRGLLHHCAAGGQGG
ncbi:ATP-grasp domain-containing protein [Streptomyces sp. BG9H]|uniref:ATP-grasp domain-containing protein n=1 Tax=Streptomyces anatolicus TaxID=2675858 RepID=A0ABS6YG42_9ACTN|nr:ATP-grasp domain-containing protein [Streptomyces anatolicus]MBW5420381.1 ATP-grasp domain-containing protein [Streptomyces anatolicus]